jgi:hypothetical protein
MKKIVYNLLTCGGLLVVMSSAFAMSDEKQKDFNSQFFMAIHTGDMQKVASLLEKGSDIKAKGFLDCAIVFYVIRLNKLSLKNLKVLEFLLENGADPNALEEALSGYTPKSASFIMI